MEDCHGTIVELKEQNLVKIKEKVQKHDNRQQVKKYKVIIEPQKNENHSQKKNYNLLMQGY